jgi:YfiH family protein
MWQLKDNLWVESNLDALNLVTTKKFGNMRDPETRKNFCSLIGIDFNKLITVQQVHGNQVAVVDKANVGKEIMGVDALISADRDISLAIFTADCIPVLFEDKKTGVFGAAHAGWRGLYSGIIKNVVELMKEEFGVNPLDIFAAIGPHIQKCCYEVGDDLIANFEFSSGNLDMSKIAQEQLKKCGVKNIEAHEGCTFHESETYFSYRRGDLTNRIMSLISKVSHK